MKTKKSKAKNKGDQSKVIRDPKWIAAIRYMQPVGTRNLYKIENVQYEFETEADATWFCRSLEHEWPGLTWGIAKAETKKPRGAK